MRCNWVHDKGRCKNPVVAKAFIDDPITREITVSYFCHVHKWPNDKDLELEDYVKQARRYYNSKD